MKSHTLLLNESVLHPHIQCTFWNRSAEVFKALSPHESGKQIWGFKTVPTLNSLSFPLQTPATQAIIRCVSKIVHEWKGHLEIFNPPQAIENFRQFLLLRTDILQNTAVGDEDFIVKRSN